MKKIKSGVKNAIKVKTLRRYVLKIQSIVAVIVVLSYTAIINFYFVNGLGEANFQDLHLETNAFAKAYQQNHDIALPNSIHFSGYLGWQSLPANIQQTFSSLRQVTNLQMKSVKKGEHNTFFLWPKHVFFMVAQPLSDGRIFYLVRTIDTEHYDDLGKTGIVKMFSLSWPLALIFLLVMHTIVQLVLTKVLKPFHQLSAWVDTLTLANVNHDVPSFKFKELNNIAEKQKVVLVRISNMLSNEQDFLRHASHELRTPIAVVNSNSELLTRVLNLNTCSDKGYVPVQRIKRAALNMQHMTETLLWLSREDNKTLAKVEVNSVVNLGEMIEHLVEDNQYLLQSKQVELVLDLDECSVQTAETPCRLILNNLIRNAFQYTAEGEVIITFSQNKVTIKNINQTPEDIDYNGADYGYGLGLRLVDKIVNKMHWHYHNNEIEGGRLVTITFENI
ncbi:MAG: signal transduction histidine kinase [Alteromonadaceae bacterium]|jgi:signal transduction histidine kinase